MQFKRLIDAIKNGKSYTDGALSEYFDSIAVGLEKFRITKYEGEFDDEVIRNIEQFIPLRNELLEVFNCLCQYRNTAETHKLLHRFFEKTISYYERPEGVNNWKGWDFDNYKFVIHELFLYCIGIMLKNECFNAVSYMVNNRFYVAKYAEYGKETMHDFSIFREYIESLESRNNRLGLNRLSLHSDLLKQRNVALIITFDQLMQADFVLYIRDCMESIKRKGYQNWFPVTLLYKIHSDSLFEIFARSESKKYFEKIKLMFEIEQKEEFTIILDAYKNNKIDRPRWQHRSINSSILLNFELLCTIP